MAADPALLRVAGLSKRFAATQALEGAELVVRRSEIHGLAGANGSGKSTLLGVLTGLHRPDAGSVLLDGVPLALGDPRAAARARIAVVTQETTLVPQLSVAENVLLGCAKPRHRGLVDWPEVQATAAAALEQLGVDIDPRQRVERLRPDERQLVELTRALSRSARLLVLDEATSTLDEQQVSRLFDLLRTLRAAGVAVVIVSHRTHELLAIADRLTVLRDGRTVAQGPASDFDARALALAITGESRHPAPPAAASARASRPVLRLRGVCAPRAPDDVSLELYAGEVVGLAGPVGSGRREVLDVLFGLRRRTAGTVLLDDEPVQLRSPRQAIAAGIGFVGADRAGGGLVGTMSVQDNVLMVSRRDGPRWRRVGGRADRERAVALLRCTGVVADPRTRAGDLSGGTQQKLMLAKWLAVAPRVLLLDEPTRGVDVGAKGRIHELIRSLSAQGTAVLLSSSEALELRAVCDRVGVMARGRLGELVPAPGGGRPASTVDGARAG